MSDVTWLARPDGERSCADALGFVAEQADCADGILVVVRTGDGYSFRAFGEFSRSDTATAAALMAFQASAQMYGED